MKTKARIRMRIDNREARMRDCVDEMQQRENEYDELRAEIRECISLTNNLSMFSITAFAATMAFAFRNGVGLFNPYLLLIPCLLVVPITLKTYHYRSNVIKISMYIALHLEKRLGGRRWETCNNDYLKESNCLRKARILLRDIELPLESAVCLSLFYMHRRYQIVSLAEPCDAVCFAIMLVAFASALVCSIRMNMVLGRKRDAYRVWAEVLPPEEMARIPDDFLKEGSCQRLVSQIKQRADWASQHAAGGDIENGHTDP